MVLVIELGNCLLILSTLICSLMGVLVDPLSNKDTIALFLCLNAIVNNYLGKIMLLFGIWRSDLSKDFYHMIIQRETFIMLRNVSSGGYVRTMRVVVCLVVPSDSTRSTHLIGLFPAGMLVGKTHFKMWQKSVHK